MAAKGCCPASSQQWLLSSPCEADRQYGAVAKTVAEFLGDRVRNPNWFAKSCCTVPDYCGAEWPEGYKTGGNETRYRRCWHPSYQDDPHVRCTKPVGFEFDRALEVLAGAGADGAGGVEEEGALARALRQHSESSDALRRVLESHGWVGVGFAATPDFAALLEDLRRAREGPLEPTANTCWKAAYLWRLQRSGAMLRIVEAGEMADNQRIEAEMAQHLGLSTEAGTIVELHVWPDLALNSPCERSRLRAGIRADFQYLAFGLAAAAVLGRRNFNPDALAAVQARPLVLPALWGLLCAFLTARTGLTGMRPIATTLFPWVCWFESPDIPGGPVPWLFLKVCGPKGLPGRAEREVALAMLLATLSPTWVLLMALPFVRFQERIVPVFRVAAATAHLRGILTAATLVIVLVLVGGGAFSVLNSAFTRLFLLSVALTVELRERQQARRIFAAMEAAGLAPRADWPALCEPAAGVHVRRTAGNAWDEEVAGESFGTTASGERRKGWVRVRWEGGGSSSCRVGAEHRYDLILAGSGCTVDAAAAGGSSTPKPPGGPPVARRVARLAARTRALLCPFRRRQWLRACAAGGAGKEVAVKAA